MLIWLQAFVRQYFQVIAFVVAISISVILQRTKKIDGVIEIGKKVARRMLIWIASASVAFYVPVSSLVSYNSIVLVKDRVGFREGIFKLGKESDLFLAVLAMIVLSASDLIDGIIVRGTKRVDTVAYGSAWIILITYFIFIIYGMPMFATGNVQFAPDSPVWFLFGSMLILGIFGEFMIASIED